MSLEHRGSVASASSATTYHAASSPAVEHAHHQPHHLKYGNVVATGYFPEESDSEENDDLNDADVDDTETASRATKAPSIVSQGSSTKQKLPSDAKARKYRALERQDAHNRAMHEQRRYIFRRPRALQYFRGNVLVRSEETRVSHRLELFFDLVFVGLIATLAEEAIREHNGDSILRYVLTYTAAWIIWNYMREIFNAFFVDDLPQRILVLGVMACLVVYGNNAPTVEKLYTESGARATAIGSYLVAGGMIFSILFFYSFYICQYRIQIRAQLLSWILLLGPWIASIFVSVRTCIALVIVALVLEYSSWMFFYSPMFKRMAKLRYSSAVAIEHEIDRLTDFVTLVHGEFLYSVISNQPAGQGIHSGVARVVLTVVIAFVFHGIYCCGAHSKRIQHPLRRNMTLAVLWFVIHLPLVSAITLCGDSTAELVKENYEVPQAVRWIFSVTYAIGMISTLLVVSLEKELDSPGELFLSKPVRLAPRLIAALIVLLLPLADQEHVNSTALLGIAAALGGVAWIWQEIGALDGPNAGWYVQKDGQDDATTQDPNAVPGSRTWKGFPTLVEPGAWRFDRTHQRGRTTTFVQEAPPESTSTPPELQQSEETPK